MSNRIIHILLFIVTSASHFNSYGVEVTDNEIDRTLKTLDSEVANREKYISLRQHRIDSLKKELQKSTNAHSSLLLTLSIGDEYVAFNNDSALIYYDRGLTRANEICNDSLANIFTLKRATYMPLAGFISEAVSEYEKIDSTTLSPSIKKLYYNAGKQMYSYIASFYIYQPTISKSWQNKSIKAQESLLKVLPTNSIEYKLNMGEYFINSNELSKADAILKDALKTLNKNDNLYARAAHAIATVASMENKTNEYTYYLALSSIADIKSATLEVVSMQELGETLLEQGDVKRAHKYSSVALANAVKCKAYMRMIESSEAMSVIEQAHTVESDTWQQMMTYIIIGTITLLIGIVAVSIFLRFKMNRLSQLQEKLQHSNKIKEIYISQFLNLSSIYMDKLHQFSNIVNRKLSAGKAEDLYKITKSGKFIEEQSKEFYEVFDNAFLNLYPTFIENVNKLLDPNQQITLKENEKMNTELRILALMRLGIEDSSRIAQMLNYSINTIYTYRNKLKNKAVNRDNFEENIMNIASIL